MRGTGTNDPDADPLAPGVQVNGIGMRRIAAPGNTRVFFNIGGTRSEEHTSELQSH